jgi:acid phosphatase (class A)
MKRKPTVVLACLALAAGCAPAGDATRSAASTPSPTRAAAIGRPYLAPADLPDGMALLPAMPQAGSADLARDREGAARAVAIRGRARWSLATADAELFAPTATAALACAAGRQIDAEATPLTFRLLSRAAGDFAASTSTTKDHYRRARPFMENGEPTCTPGAEAVLRKNGSYPSGHSAVGYGWGLVLAELIPSRTTALVARGRAFGDSRRVCNVHWLSDVEEGRVTATATFARLQSHPDFQADVAAARDELAAAPAVPPKRDCPAEAAALSGA